MDAPVALKCPNCGSQLRGTDINADTGLVTCSYCRALSTMPGGTNNAAAKPPEPMRARPAVPLPQRMSIEHEGLTLVLTRSWFSHVAWFLVFFCIAWDGFLVFWYSIAFSTDSPWIMKVFPLAHVAIGVGLTYYVLCLFTNQTRVVAGQGKLSVGHGPLPWRGNMELEAGQIAQLHCKEVFRSGRNGGSLTFEVIVTMRDGTSRKLITGLNESEQALYLEQQIEKALGVQDKPMAGELPR